MISHLHCGTFSASFHAKICQLVFEVLLRKKNSDTGVLVVVSTFLRAGQVT